MSYHPDCLSYHTSGPVSGAPFVHWLHRQEFLSFKLYDSMSLRVCFYVICQDGKPVQLSKLEKAQQAVLSEDGMSVTCHKGYRMVRPVTNTCAVVSSST